MAAVIRIKRGTQAQLDAAAASSGLKAGEPYLVDGDTLCVGISTTAYIELANKSELDGILAILQEINS